LIKRTVIKKVPVSCSGQVNYTKVEEILQNVPVMASMFTIDSHPAFVLFDSGASHSFMNMGFADGHNISIMAIPIAYRINTPVA
jgi:prepilin-type processing-associated H-X9-DG protein